VKIEGTSFSSLEFQSQGQLQFSWRSGSDAAGVQFRVDLAKRAWTRDVAQRKAILRMIEYVERFTPEHQVQALCQGNAFTQRKVQLPIIGSSSEVASAVSERAGCGRRKGSWIEKIVNRLTRRKDVLVRNRIGALRTAGISIGNGAGLA
jgi:hypothetical protein